MKRNDLFDRFYGMVPWRRRSMSDWIVPAAVGLGVGVAAGLGVGMLLAPQPGDETRRQLRERALRVRDKARHAIDRARHEAVETGRELEAQPPYDQMGGLP